MNMQLNEKAAFIKGVIEGLELDPKDKQTKVLKLMSELLVEMAQEIKELEECYDDVCDQVDAISEDLAGVEDIISDEWDGTRVGRRGQKYLALKESKASECLDLAETGLPGLKDAVEGIWTSTPLSWRDYTASEGGSAYGIMKDWRNPLGSVISPRTPVPNLFLPGQNLNLHGILGTSMTSFLTAGAVLGRMPSTLL